MFSSFTDRLRAEVATLKRVLDTHDSLRSLVFPQLSIVEAIATPGAATEAADSLREIRIAAPPKTSWQVYDHCAAFTRLYAVYEQFVQELVSDYLRMLPELYPLYGDLPLSVTKQHRVGVGQILLRLGKDGPYREVGEKEIIQGISQGLLGSTHYTLLAEAFLTDPQNYRAEMLIKLFSYIGLENCWPWIEKHPLMAAFMNQHRDSNETAKTLLHEFVEYRNKASHTVVAEIVATEEIQSVADFVVVLSEVLAQLVMKQAIQRKKALGQVTLAGMVVHKFRNNIVGVEMSGGEIAVGDELVVIQKQLCFKANVLSIQSHETPHQRLVSRNGQRIGMQLNVRAAKGAELLRLPTSQPTVALEEPAIESVVPDEDQIEQQELSEIDEK